MARTTFQLRDKKVDSETPIMLIFNFGYYEIDKDNKKNYRFLKVATGKKVHPKFWNNEKYRVRQNKDCPNYNNINQTLIEIETKIEQIHSDLAAKKIRITPELLHSEYKKWQKGDMDRIPLFEFIEKFIEDTRSGRRNIKGKRLSSGLVTSYQSTLNHLKDFAAEKTGGHFDYENVTLDFYNEFIQYLYNETEVSSPNSVSNYIKNIKLFMGEAYEKKLHQNLDFKNKRFSKPQVETDEIYLTDEEITKIYELDLSDKPKLEISRDFFIVGCKTALRVSDFTNLNKENIVFVDNTKCLRLRHAKTDAKVIIPLHTYAVQILEKYNYKLVYGQTNSTLNAHLKVIGKLAGINDEIPVRRYVNGKKVTESIKKYKLIKSHSGRRSACSNLYKAGVPSETIMGLSGHTNTMTFMKYLKLNEEEHARMLIGSGLFKQ